MARAWTVRGGKQGEREQAALDEGLVLAGWESLGDLSGCTSIEELGEQLQRTYPDEAPRTVRSWTHQLWRFLKMDTGDLVVMPRKFRSVIAIGRLSGEYEYRGQNPPGFRHVREVMWERRDVERAAVKGDLRDSMGSLLTISELSRGDAVRRVEALAADGVDPGYHGYIEPPTGPVELESDVEESGSRQLTARDLIGLWGWSRRTVDVIDLVDRELGTRGLRVDPHFTDVRMDGIVTVSAVAAANPEADVAAPEGGHTYQDSAVGTAGGSDQADLAWRIGSLPFVRDVVTIEEQAPLSRAVTRMIQGDFSQLPVVGPHNRLIGAVTWEGIARAQLGRREGTIAEAMHRHPRTARESEELFGRIGDIQHRGFLIIVDAEGVVVGVLTASDLAAQLKLRVEPFTLLEEVERRLRRAVGCFTLEELRASHKPHMAAKIHSAADLTLGAYRFLIDDDARWAKLDWPYEREDMVDRLKTVSAYRNALAHWDVDAPEQDAPALDATRQLLKLLQVIDRDPTPGGA
ncbi:CBS domain-containing protein [Streptomyces sp. NBC_00536]|uniref:CBS domain-containing protein n=1 Tax=Streptomyces sp. NBC_00536 TaxID=2975769 RepID=UPI002E7FD061|nr:CBS domain-containing protein [Streptomyces sp. NBC_00536]WUC77783.1 CBS domain-containing protein [Streptomyces sp. NBC_00536]